MKYSKLKDAQQRAFNNFEGIIFAFSNKQLEDGLAKLGASKSDIIQGSAGCFILKSREAALDTLLETSNKEMKENISNPTSSEKRKRQKPTPSAKQSNNKKDETSNESYLPRTRESYLIDKSKSNSSGGISKFTPCKFSIISNFKESFSERIIFRISEKWCSKIFIIIYYIDLLHIYRSYQQYNRK